MFCSIGVCVLLFAGQIFGQDTYRDYDGNFSFTLPDGWEAITADKLPADTKNAIADSFKGQTLAICQETHSDYLMPPSILVQSHPYEGSAENAGIFLDSQEGSDSLIAEAKTLAKWLSDRQKGKFRITYTDGYFNSDKYIGYGEVEAENESGKNIFVAVVKILGADSMTVLRCYWQGTYSDQFQDLVYELADSFKYEKGYAFGQRSGSPASRDRQNQYDDTGYEDDRIYDEDAEDTEGFILDDAASDALTAKIIGAMIIGFFVKCLIFAVCLWGGMHATGESGPFWALLVASVGSALAGMIPIGNISSGMFHFPLGGIILSWITMFVLLGKLAGISGANAFRMVVLAHFIQIILVVVLMMTAIGGLFML